MVSFLLPQPLADLLPAGGRSSARPARLRHRARVTAPGSARPGSSAPTFASATSSSSSEEMSHSSGRMESRWAVCAMVRWKEPGSSRYSVGSVPKKALV